MKNDFFINMGAHIKGESHDAERRKHGDIDVQSWRWGMEQTGDTHTGGGGGSGKANFHNLSFTKFIDSSSNALMLALAKGAHIPVVSLIARKSGAGHSAYIEITMEEVMVVSIDTGKTGGKDRITERVCLNFARVNFAYKPQSTSGSSGAGKEFSWDIKKNSQIE